MLFATVAQRQHHALFFIAALPFKAQLGYSVERHQSPLALDVDLQILTPLEVKFIDLVLIAVAIDNRRFKWGRTCIHCNGPQRGQQ